MLRLALALAALVPLVVLQPDPPAAKVQLLRTPHGGIQPQALVDEQGTLHLIYFKGNPEKGDVFYITSKDGGDTFSTPLRVNSHPDSVIAMGNVRGAHLALGKNGRVHVAWMGSSSAKPRAVGDKAPMLYARLNDAGTAFEPQRNLIEAAVGLDGGASVAADRKGNVYVAWHAPAPGKAGEENRQVWFAHSKDDGKTFAREVPADTERTGACGCCGMRAFCDSHGNLYALYRAAQTHLHRDMFLLISPDQGKTVTASNLQKWEIDHCPMTTAAFAEGKKKVFLAWETKGQVSFTSVDPKSGKLAPLTAAPGQPKKDRKHPALAVNAQGQVLLAWTEGMGWNKGGELAWCVFDKSGQATEVRGQAPGVPVWSIVTAVTLANGEFRIFY